MPLLGFLIWAIVVIIIGYLAILLLGLIPGLPAIVPTLVWIAVALVILMQFAAMVGAGPWPAMRWPCK